MKTLGIDDSAGTLTRRQRMTAANRNADDISSNGATTLPAGPHSKQDLLSTALMANFQVVMREAKRCIMTKR